eukprot:GFYU01006495.1.p1 GENE.GFYU01006495.1~~GFYU01006495.1.p1  ORF type:complete len:785 (-),score=288.48 GFYU01006495.1:82-2406(-)
MYRLSTQMNRVGGASFARSMRWAGSPQAGVIYRPMSAAAKKNVTVEKRPDGIAMVRMDLQDSKVNVLNMAMANDIIAAFDEIQTDPNIKASVLISAKPNDFVAGADINMFVAAKTADEMENGISKMCQDQFLRMESGKPIVAAINGNCLGGGLELALACTYRVASSSPKTTLGLPEVQLGILPGGGGTQRLPKLVGMQNAVPMMLTGSKARPAKAKKIKLVDQVADPFALEDAAIQAAKGLADGSLKIDREAKDLVGKLTKKVIEGTSFGKDFFFQKATEQVMKASKGMYPAPLKILDVVRESSEKGFGSPAGYAAEAKGFGELGMTPESQSLVSLFFASQDAKKHPYGKPKHEINTIGVIGAGLMGAGITEVSITKGYNVNLKDMGQEGLARGFGQIHANLSKKVKKRQMTQADMDRTMSNIMEMTGNDASWTKHFKHNDMVIEAVNENLDIKHIVLKEVEESCPPHCIFASNTSSLPIRDIAAKAKRPENVIGLHYFSPVPQMPLVEIIPHEGTSKEVIAAAFQVASKQGKTPIVVKDVAGFYVNRCLGPYMDECIALLGTGVAPKDLDQNMVKAGFPVGPISLADEVGIDVGFSVHKNLRSDLGVRVGAANRECMDAILDAGFLGRKASKGFYKYDTTKKSQWDKFTDKLAGVKSSGKEINPEAVALVNKFRKPGKPVSVEDQQMRMLTRFVNEAMYCLQDEIIANPVAGDIGAVFGIGYPPFLGGPFNWVDATGAQKVVDTLYRFRDENGEQFEPAQILKDYAASGKKFR